jgi:hypothetical protein
MALELLVITGPLHGCIAPGLRKGEVHRLLEELEALHIIDSLLGALDGGKDNEGLALGLEVRLGHNVNDLAVLREQLLQRLAELVGLDALLQVAHVQSAIRLVRCALRRGAVRVGVQ